MKKVKAVFDESKDGFTYVPPGTYPMNIISFGVKDINDSKVFNMKFRVADEVSKLKVAKTIKNGDGGFTTAKSDNGEDELISATFISGMEYFNKGVWLTPNPEKGKGWQNRKYLEFCENIGIAFDEDKDGIVQLGEIEEEDVLGLPCLGALKTDKFTNAQGEEVSVLKVMQVFPWADGTRLSEEELGDDVPF